MRTKTARMTGRLADRAPEAAVKAGIAVVEYLENDTAANHRFLYGQVEVAARRTQEELRKRLQNPHITIAAIADSFLTGRAVGAVCSSWTLVRIGNFKKMAGKAKDASKRWRETRNAKPPPSSSCGPKQEDCFWRTLLNATGDPSYALRKEAPTLAEIHAKLKQHFGGANAKDPLTGRRGDLQKMAEGMPVDVTTDEFVKVLTRMPNNSEGMVFVTYESGGYSHIFSLAKFAGSHLFWDDQIRSSNMDKLFSGVATIRWFRYK